MLPLPPTSWLPMRGSGPACSMVIDAQSTASSSATRSGSAVKTPCPMSGRGAHTVTFPDGSMRRKGLGARLPPWAPAVEAEPGQ